MTEEQLLDRLATEDLHRLTGPPEHWLTTYNTGFWGINENPQNVNDWQKLQPGALCLFHSTAKTESDSLSNGPAESSIIAVGEVSHLGQKESLQWMGEIEDEENGWPNLIYFRQIWWLGRIGQIENEPIREKMSKGSRRIETDIAALVDGALELSEYEAELGKGFPTMGSISGIILDPSQKKTLASMIDRRSLKPTYPLEAGQPDPPDPTPSGGSSTEGDVSTGTYKTQKLARVGQSEFSENVQDNYDHQCCFPGCEVADNRYLIGAHIARWADREDLRGDVSNGLCFCLHHDKAFEVGHFTIDEDLRVWTTVSQVEKSTWAQEHILPHAGEPIKKGEVPPHPEALKDHWKRLGFDEE